MAVSIHPSVDNGVKQGSKEFRRRYHDLQMHGQARQGVDRRAGRAQSRLRLHSVLEAEGRAVLDDRGRRRRTR